MSVLQSVRACGRPPAARGAARADLAGRRSDAVTASATMAWIQPNIQQPPQPNIIQQQQACWSSAMRGDWKPAQHEMRAHSYTIANDAGGWRGRDLPYARRRWEHYKWTPSAASGLRSIR